MTGGVIAFGNEDVVVLTALQRLVQGNGRTHESFLNSAKSFKARLQFKVVVAGSFGNGGNNGDIVAFGAYVVCGGDNRNIDICPS